MIKIPKNPVPWLAAFFIVLSSPAGAVASEPAHASAAEIASHLQLKWDLIENIYPPSNPYGEAHAAFTLTNSGDAPLSSRGWALYFNALDGVEPAELARHLAIEQIDGNLFRLVPRDGFAGLAPGQSLKVDYFHSYTVTRPARIPVGPYLVFDDAPAKGYAIRHYSISPIVRPEQLNKGPTDPVPVITPEMVYERNQNIRDLLDREVPPVFPTPMRLLRAEGHLHLASMPVIGAEESLLGEAAFARELLQPYLPPAKGSPGAHPLALRLAIGKVPGVTSPEAYRLVINPKNGIVIIGNSAAGVFYGLQSLRDLLPITPDPDHTADLPALEIIDAPRFPFRSFHLDVARNFESKATIFRLLDLMARYKLNTFHFHLTDNEGWRIEIPSLPELTSFGGRRGHAVEPADHLTPMYGSGPDTDDPYGSGHYSRADYIEILKYAKARHIDVIPEVEMPAHAQAAVKSMEYRYRRLMAAGDRKGAEQYLLSEYPATFARDTSVMVPARPSVYAFIERVTADIAAMHKEAGVPLSTLHVGSDELPANAWDMSPMNHALMKEQGMKSMADLWDYFYDHVDGILRKQGLAASGWEELAIKDTSAGNRPSFSPNPHFLDHGFNIFIWANTGEGREDLAYKLANAGYKIVLAPASNYYFDMSYNKNPDEPGVNWAAFIGLNAPYDFIPLDYFKNTSLPPERVTGKEKLTPEGKERILGLEACLWTETIRGQDRIDYMAVPRLLALAERAWAPDPDWANTSDATKAKALHDQAWSGFVNELGKRVLPRLDADKAPVRYRIPPPGLKASGGQVLVNYQLPGFTLRYTTDGSEPNVKSPEVDGPIKAQGMIRVAAFDHNGRRGHVASVENR